MVKEKAFSLQLNNDYPAAPLATPSSLVLFALIVGLFIGARLWGLTASCFWFDEIFSVHAARHEWSRLPGFLAADIIHPPLFYALLKVWISIGGESLVWLRLFPALSSIAVIIPFFLLCRELRLGATEIKLALLLMAVNGYLIKYAQEVRMYSLLLLFTVCSLWLFTRFFNAMTDSRKQLLALFVFNLLLVYTHYYGWLVITAEVALLLLWGRDKLADFLIAVAVLLLCFSPWVYLVILAAEPGKGLAQNIGWVTRPGLADAIQFFTLLNDPFYFRQSSNELLYSPLSLLAGIMLFGLPLLTLVWQLVRQGRKAGRQPFGTSEGTPKGTPKFLLLLTFLPLVLAFLVSWVLPYSAWGTRHLIVVSVPYLLLAAIALIRLHPEWLRITVSLLLGCWWFLAGAGMLLSRGENHIWCTWEQLSRQIIQQQPNATEVKNVYAFEALIAYHLWFALEDAEGERFKVRLIKGIPGLHEDPAYFLPRAFSDIEVQDLSALNEKHFWIAFRDTSWSEERPPIKTMTEKGYQVRSVLEVKAGGQRAFLVELWHQ